MSENFGQLTHRGDYIRCVMARELEASATETWQMLCQESNRVKWLAPGTIDLYTGGRARLDFKDSYVIVDSEVTECRENEVLAFSWSGKDDPLRPIRFELLPERGTCRVRLTVSIPADEVVARSCAGWEAHLTMLQAALAGVSIKFPLDRFKECRAAFEAQLDGVTTRQKESTSSNQ